MTTNLVPLETRNQAGELPLKESAATRHNSSEFLCWAVHPTGKRNQGSHHDNVDCGMSLLTLTRKVAKTNESQGTIPAEKC